MYIKIGPYKSWFGPHQLAETLCWWTKYRDEYGLYEYPDWVHSFGEWLAHGSIEPRPKTGDIRKLNRERPETWLYRLLLWIDSFKQRKVYVRIDRWDSWSADDTLAIIILPLLKQLKQQKQGSPHVDDMDVPEHLRSTAVPPKENEWDIDDNHHARWDWVLDQMIWAFQQKVNDNWEDQFYVGESDLQFEKQEDGNFQLTQGPKHTAEFDREGYAAYSKRMDHGFALFGKYYQSLWS